MAVNLVGSVGRERARKLLESSFAQFQADKAVVGLARQVARNEEALAGYAEAMTCHLGDFAEYARLRVALKDREAALARDSAARCAPTRATAAPSARTTPAGPSAGTSSPATPTRCARGCAAGRARSRARSTTSSRCWSRSGTCAATPSRR